VFSALIPSEASLIEHYDKYKRDTAHVSETSFRRRNELLETFERFRSTNRILDVGCGTGEILNQARGRGWQTFGTEYTQRAVGICVANGHSMQLGILNESNYAADSFDVVIYTEVFEHIVNHRAELARVFRLLRPGGLLYVTTPNFNSLSRRLLGDRWTVIQFPEHLSYFTPSTLRLLCAGSGFVPVAVRTTGFSYSRWRAGMRGQFDTIALDTAADETIRSALEDGAGRWVKRTVNALLGVTGLGDSLKGAFLKPGSASLGTRMQGS
jgi:SAM-dependent methyltransferase